jgi:uncharacterized protein YhbP (UPF0306 family)
VYFMPLGRLWQPELYHVGKAGLGGDQQVVDESQRRGRETPSEAALRILKTHTVFTLATEYQGEPHAVSLMYVNEGFTLFWVSDPRSRHSLALAESSRAAVTVADHFTDFRDIEGLQSLGTAHRVADKAAGTRGFRLLADRYRFLSEFLTGPASLARRLELAAVYRFEPDEMTLIDNTQGFGHKDAVQLPARD